MKQVCTVLVLAVMLASVAYAGGPLVVGGPSFGKDGEAFVWDASQFPIKYRVDGGAMSAIVDNATGLSRVQSMFNNWQVPTASITYSYAGPIQATGAFTGGDVRTVSQFNAVYGSCVNNVQNPIIFDADGSIVAGLGLDPDIIGFAAPCNVDGASGHITSGFALLNGRFQDGINSGINFELTSAQFDEAITHELGHFSGLDHSQINIDILYNGGCSKDQLAGLPLMFPFAVCQARSSVGLPILATDDVAWISKLYSVSSAQTTYGTISGQIYASDGITGIQGVNVIARRIDDPNTSADESKGIAVSVVSGFKFTGNPGQSVTGDNTGGDQTGSRSPQQIGYFEIPVPAGTYTVEVETIWEGFKGGSGLGPLDPPIGSPGLPEFWTQNQSAFNYRTAKDTIVVAPGQIIHGINIILNGTPPRFDQFEDGGAMLRRPVLYHLRSKAVQA